MHNKVTSLYMKKKGTKLNKEAKENRKKRKQNW